MFHVFMGDQYYPAGGVWDHKFSGTLEECVEYVKKHSSDWHQIANENMQEVNFDGVALEA